MRQRTLVIGAVAAYGLARLWARVKGGSSPSPVEVPGMPRSASLRMLETGARALQPRRPIEALNHYLNGFHFRSGDTRVQMEAHHYCRALNDEVIQCVIYDGNTPDAKLVGVEYIISERLFRTLPDEERWLWHSHHYETASGQLLGPGLPWPAERALLERLTTTYGKTWHTWDTHRDPLPLGIPMLMMGFTADGQLDPRRLAERDARFGVSTEARRQRLADLPRPEVVPGANAWEQGRVAEIDRVFRTLDPAASRRQTG